MDIDNWIAELHRHGAQEVEQYHQKLLNFGSNEQKVFELLSEARTALLFLKNGWRVTMREKPDLLFEYDGVSIYGEVKHMNEKETDRLDAEAMAKSSCKWGASARMKAFMDGNRCAASRSRKNRNIWKVSRTS